MKVKESGVSAIKEEAKRLVEGLPEDATWDDLIYQAYVKAKISKAIAAAEAGDVVSHEEAKKQLLG
jgi:predicted transcriptional regulator